MSNFFERTGDLIWLFMAIGLAIYFWNIEGGGKSISYILVIAWIMKLTGMQINNVIKKKEVRG